MKFGLFDRTHGSQPLETFDGDSLYAHEGNVTILVGHGPGPARYRSYFPHARGIDQAGKVTDALSE